MIRFLKGEATPAEIEAAGTAIKFEVSVLTTAEQARLLDIAQRAKTITGMQAYMSLMLKTCVKSLNIGGQLVDAKELAERADISHKPTLEIMQAIASECARILFPSDDTLGKSGSQQERQ